MKKIFIFIIFFLFINSLSGQISPKGTAINAFLSSIKLENIEVTQVNGREFYVNKSSENESLKTIKERITFYINLHYLNPQVKITDASKWESTSNNKIINSLTLLVNSKNDKYQLIVIIDPVIDKIFFTIEEII